VNEINQIVDKLLEQDEPEEVPDWGVEPEPVRGIEITAYDSRRVPRTALPPDVIILEPDQRLNRAARERMQEVILHALRIVTNNEGWVDSDRVLRGIIHTRDDLAVVWRLPHQQPEDGPDLFESRWDYYVPILLRRLAREGRIKMKIDAGAGFYATLVAPDALDASEFGERVAQRATEEFGEWFTVSNAFSVASDVANSSRLLPWIWSGRGSRLAIRIILDKLALEGKLQRRLRRGAYEYRLV